MGGEPLEYVLNGRVQKVRAVVELVFACEQNIVEEQVRLDIFLLDNEDGS